MPNHNVNLYNEPRTRMLSWMRQVLIGVGHKDDTVSTEDRLIGIRPSARYATGILFPVFKDGTGLDQSVEEADNEDDLNAELEDEREIGQPARKRRYIPPSAAGFSFCASKDLELYIVPWAVCYRKTDKRRQQWQRIPVSRYEAVSVSISSPLQPGVIRERIWDGRAELFTLWRQHGTGWLVTVSLCNCQVYDASDTDSDGQDQEREEKSLFEVELRCDVVRGTIHAYPRKAHVSMDEEEQELELQYRNHQLYAVGHGAAVDWQMDANAPGRVTGLQLGFLPSVEVPIVTPNNGQLSAQTLSLKFLAQGDIDSQTLCTALAKFVETYANWQIAQTRQTAGLVPHQQEAARRMLKRIDQAITRMRKGVELLRDNQDVRRAFQMANEVMLCQMAQGDQIRGKAPTTYRWRPFQLGFLLVTLESVINRDSEFRDTVDLIWFPTGGGKTEAYLGLIAFQILWRRQCNSSSGGGTAVIMRYTLRLLTQQQFQRAATLICALELMRRKQPQLLGQEPITVGLWVGNATSPNRFKEAMEVLERATDENPPRKFVLVACPWCGEPFQPSGTRTGYQAAHDSFSFRCHNPTCELGAAGAEPLPINVVDESLYQHPPTLLFATVDKFARLAWDARTSIFFGGGENVPPELIIQDELHLIAGALGSIVGLYEAALDCVLRGHGVHAKIVASTATIRDAARQVRRLYGRDHAVFPPPGLSADDAFFTRVVPTEERPGRTYIGYLAGAMAKRDAFASLAAAVLAAPIALFREQNELLDAWWTLVVYHGSLRGVGESHNSLMNSINDFLPRNLGSDAQGEGSQNENELHHLITRLTQVNVEQLTSMKSAQANAHTFGRLEKDVTHSECLDVALATNMISVGLDVSRLALMIVNGQPLTTAEYIQASSRVGRGEVPGIIVANYYRHQARSLSHYENFRPYHETFYRFVEPTSVTPFTYQARKRALHAALVIVMRHVIGSLQPNDGARHFDRERERPATERAIGDLKKRCESADPEHAKATNEHIDALVRAWYEKARRCRAIPQNLVYRQPQNDQANDALLYAHGDNAIGLWETLHSMRNVEDNGLLRTTGRFDPPGD